SLRSHALDEPSSNENARGSDEPAGQEMADLLGRLDRVCDPAVLLGTEGQAAALHFSQFGRMLKPAVRGRDFDFKTRNRRPPRDPVNAHLSFAYAMLLEDCFSALCAVAAVGTLRGQFADNREWSADPARPAVNVGTVDMIGSRLLFSGYGIGFKSK